MNKIKLFCFPYAGGATTVFTPWQSYLEEAIELRPVELAGRGRRIGEPLYRSAEEGVTEILKEIKEEIAEGPYAFFGHSMGAMIAHELARKIQLEKLNGPEHLFFSGRGAPHFKVDEKRKYHLLDEEDFKRKVLDLGGTPPEFFEHPELLEIFLPLLRNDFKLACTDFSDREILPHTCDISVLLGKEEDVTAKEAIGWKKHTHGLCQLYYFNGGHFFLNEATAEIVQIINTTLHQSIPSLI